MPLFSGELKEQKGARRKITARIRKLRGLMAWHYILLGLSLFNSCLTFFAIINGSIPYKGMLLIFLSLSLVIWLYLLFSGI